MVKVIGPLASHHASGRMSAPRVYSSSLRNRHDREAPPVPPPPTLFSLLFTNTGDHCSAPTINLPQQTPGTLETWIRFTGYQGYLLGTMFGDTNCGAMINLVSNVQYARVACVDKYYNITYTALPALNQWIHYAITWSTPLLTLWIDGQNTDTDTPGSRTIFTHDNFHVGGAFQTGYPKLQAYICRARFSDIIRYTANFSPPTDFTPDANTIALWRMTEGTGVTVADESGNNHTLNFPATNKPTWSDLVP